MDANGPEGMTTRGQLPPGATTTDVATAADES
jgi:hypothetical protein